MKMRHLFALLILLAATPLFAAKGQKKNEGPMIRLLLCKETHAPLLEVKGPYRVHRGDTGAMLSFGMAGKRFVIHSNATGMQWGEEYPDVFHLVVVPTSPGTRFYVGGLQYKGSLNIYHHRNDAVTVVNEVSVEDYLKSTLAYAFEHPSEGEALAAIVIAARSEVYAQIRDHEDDLQPWHLSARDTGYLGHGVTNRRPALDATIERTRFMALDTLGPSSNGFSLEMAQELADKGNDARRILSKMFPGSHLSVPFDPRFPS